MKKTKYLTHRSIQWILIILVALLLVRVSMPFIATWYINKSIDATLGISGQIEEVDIALLRGAYRIKKIEIIQESDEKSQPLIFIETLDLSILWSAIFSGNLVAEIKLTQPTLSFYDEPKEKIVKSEKLLNETTWLGLTNNVIPFAVERLVIEDGTIEINAQNTLKKARFAIENIQATAENFIINSPNNPLASIDFSGKIQNQAEIVLTSKIDPNSMKPNIDLAVEMAKLPLIYVDAPIKFYAPFDIEAGEVDLALEMKVEEGNVDGYLKLGVYNLEVFSWHEDVKQDNDGPIQIFIDAVSGFFSSLFENDNKDLIATKIPLSGTLNDPEISAFDAFIGILRNAFIEAYQLNVEDSVPGLDVESDDAKK